MDSNAPPKSSPLGRTLSSALARAVDTPLLTGGVRGGLIVFLFISSFSFSQDSTNKPLTFFVSEKSFDRGTYSTTDTTLNNYHYYLPGYYYNTLGNSGSPAQSMYYAVNANVGFNVGINFLAPYSSKKENINYFNTRRPYSKVFFVSGSRREQVLKVFHTQNIGRQFNFGLNYTNIISDGFYQLQKTKLNDVVFFSHYQTKNNLYGNFFNFIYDKMEVQENGGLAASPYGDFAFENGYYINEQLDVNLTSATNLYKKKSYYLKNYLNIGKREEVFDVIDSVTRKVVSPFLRLSHTFSFEKNIYNYEDKSPDSLYYSNLFVFDSLRPVFDSINTKTYENTVSLSTVDFTDLHGKHYGLKNLYASVFVKKQDVIRVTHNIIFDTSLQNLITGAELRFRFLKMFSAGGNASDVFSGFNSGDHYYEGYLDVHPPSHNLRFYSYHQIKHPDWLYSYYFSDQLHWENHFQYSSYSGQGVSYNNEKWNMKLGASQNYVKNYIYLDFARFFGFTPVTVLTDTVDSVFVTYDSLVFTERIVPQQRIGRIGINQIYLSKNFKLWKFHLNTKLYYQKSNDERYLRLPELITCNSFYYENYMLRKSLYGQIGVDFYYNTGYYADAYSPFLKTFYLQNEKMTGNYPFFDFFINIKIKSVKAFFKVTHFNWMLQENYYFYSVPYYPQQPRAFRFGIEWKFLD